MKTPGRVLCFVLRTRTSVYFRTLFHCLLNIPQTLQQFFSHASSLFPQQPFIERTADTDARTCVRPWTLYLYGPHGARTYVSHVSPLFTRRHTVREMAFIHFHLFAFLLFFFNNQSSRSTHVGGNVGGNLERRFLNLECRLFWVNFFSA